MTRAGPALAASVIVLAYDAVGVILGCLQALKAQDHPGPFETIVVWSGDDRIPGIVRRECPEARIVGRLERLPTGAARNLGIEHSRGDIIAFLAADCRPAPDWLRNRISAHQSGFRCVGGAVLLAEPAGAIARASHLLEYSECLPGRPREVVRDRPVYNLSFDRRIFAEHGGYEPGLACGEDSLFNARLVGAGEPMLYEPAIRIAHAGPASIREYIAHQMGHGAAYGRIIRDYGYGAHRTRAKVPRVAILVRYPYARLRILAERLLRFRRDLVPQAIGLSPLIVLGVIACMAGLVGEWWGWARRR
jgi:glycosyltransferase involved in cell wall biosynthesis